MVRLAKMVLSLPSRVRSVFVKWSVRSVYISLINKYQTTLPNVAGMLYTELLWFYDTIRYDTIEEFNVDSKAEYTA